jgi:hypothetical protein
MLSLQFTAGAAEADLLDSTIFAGLRLSAHFGE